MKIKHGTLPEMRGLRWMGDLYVREEDCRSNVQAALRVRAELKQAIEEFVGFFSLVGLDGPKGEAEIPHGLHSEGVIIPSKRLYESYERLAKLLELQKND